MVFYIVFVKYVLFVILKIILVFLIYFILKKFLIFNDIYWIKRLVNMFKFMSVMLVVLKI